MVVIFVLIVLYTLGLAYVETAEETGINAQSFEERQYPKFHKCVDLGEAYSAAYLTTKVHLMMTNIWRNYSWVSCEMASTIMLSTAKRSMKVKLQKFRENPDEKGIAIMSLDILDFSIVHLSAYERLQRKYKKKLKLESDSNIALIQTVTSLLKNESVRSHDTRYNERKMPQWAWETVTVMPFLGVNMGAVILMLVAYHILKVCSILI